MHSAHSNICNGIISPPKNKGDEENRTVEIKFHRNQHVRWHISNWNWNWSHFYCTQTNKQTYKMIGNKYPRMGKKTNNFSMCEFDWILWKHRVTHTVRMLLLPSKNHISCASSTISVESLNMRSHICFGKKLLYINIEWQPFRCDQLTC